MDVSHRKRMMLAALVVYLVAAAVSVSCLAPKRDSIQFHTRDYAYFIEQAAKYADPGLTNRYATNIDGFNFLGLQGPEGVRSMYQAIHAEYFRYTYTLIYALFHSTLPIYIFYCLIFYLPFLYFAYLPRGQTGGAWKQLALFILLFLSFPGLFATITFDLRPRELFVSAWILLILAIFYKRPFREKLIFFGFLLLIREEGILLGLIALVLDFIQNRQWKASLVFLGLDVAALAAFLAFMQWGGYTQVDFVMDPVRLVFGTLSTPANLILVTGAALILILAAAWFWFRRRSHFNDFLLLAVYLAGSAVTGLPVYRNAIIWAEQASLQSPVSAWEVSLHAFTDPANTFLYYIFLLVPVLLWDFTRGRWRTVLQGLMAALCGSFAIASLLTVPPQVSAMKNQLAPARLVWDFKDQIDRYQAQVLVDFNTYQVFYDCEHIVVYNRLPLWLVETENRYYPENKAFVAKIIRERMEYAVISRDSLQNVRELANLAGLPSTELASNDQFVILKFR